MGFPLTQERLKMLLDYDSETGVFTWKHGKKLGEKAGYTHHEYLEICFDGKPHKAASLAWLYVYGEYLTRLDHKNKLKNDDRIDNLRPASRSQNGANKEVLPNNKLGVKGVYYDASRDRYVAQITYNGKTRRLGRFKSEVEAALAYKKAAEELHGEFAYV